MAMSSKYLKFKKRKKERGDQKIVKDAFVKGVGLRNVALRKAAIPLPSFFSADNGITHNNVERKRRFHGERFSTTKLGAQEGTANYRLARRRLRSFLSHGADLSHV